MRLAYIISAYKLAHQLVRLVDRLNAPDVSLFIHIDSKADPAIASAMHDGLTGRFNVTFLPRHRCDWGGFGHVAATLEGISAIVDSQTTCDYVALLTGQDYPLKTNDQIGSYLAERHGAQFMEYFSLPFEGWTGQGLDRFEGWHVRFRGRRWTLRPPGGYARRIPGGLRPYGGSSYWFLTGDAIGFVHDYVRAHPAYVRFFRYVNVPDEMFFQTIMLNSDFAEQVVNDNLRYIEWNDTSSGSPDVLDETRLDRLAASNALFARKFDSTVDGVVLDAIDERLLGVRPALPR